LKEQKEYANQNNDEQEMVLFSARGIGHLFQIDSKNILIP
jgi:hypothetical protein